MLSGDYLVQQDTVLTELIVNVLSGDYLVQQDTVAKYLYLRAVVDRSGKYYFS